MNRKNLLKVIVSCVLYFGGILFALYISLVIISGNVMFDFQGLIISMLGVCIPIMVATFLLISGIQNIEKRYLIMKIFVSSVTIFYSILLITILFRNGFRRAEAISLIGIKEHLKLNANFIPLKTICKYIQAFINNSMNKSIIIENLLGNLFLFSPMGILLPCLFQKLYKFKNFLITIIVIVVSVEVFQLVTRTGSCDIDDILLNLSGAILFYGLWSINTTQKLLNKFYVIKVKKTE